MLQLVAGSTGNLSESSETAVAVTSEKDSSAELKIVADESAENDHNNNREDLLDNSSDTSPQHTASTDYGIEISEEDKITLLVQTGDSKLSDIR